MLRLLPAYTPVNCYVVFIYRIFQTGSKAELNSIVSWFIGAPARIELAAHGLGS